MLPIKINQQIIRKSRRNGLSTLVEGQHPKAEHQITTFGGKQLTLIIQANPLDEITEVWQESMGFFSSLLSLDAVYFFGRQSGF